MSTIKKPHPSAIQTIYGWALPNTGEILVSKRGLPNPVEGFKIGKPWKNEDPIIKKAISHIEIKEIPVETIEETFEEMVAEVPVIKAKRVTRKKPVEDVVE